MKQIQTNMQLCLNDIVQKMKGSGKGEQGRVTAIDGKKIRVTKPDQMSFKMQSAANFKLITAAIDIPGPVVPSRPPSTSSTSSVEGNLEPVTPVRARPVLALLAQGIGLRTVEGVQSPREHSTTEVYDGAPTEGELTRNSTCESITYSSSDLCKTPLLNQQHSVTICCWNTLKLAFVEDESRAELLEQCAHRLVVDLGVDVLMLSEISKCVGKRRVNIFKGALEQVAGVPFQVEYSDLSGVGERDTQQEYHVVLVKQGVEIEATLTHHNSNNMKNDHAPFTVCLADNRFKDTACKRIVLTGVHFPPRTRQRDQFLQIRSFFNAYETEWPAQLKRRRPMTFASKDKHFAAHIIGGDFNLNPNELDLPKSRWTTLFDDETTTSSGHQSYDNFVFNSASYKAYLDISKNLGGFPLSHTGSGPSDHDAVLITLRERIDHTIL